MDINWKKLLMVIGFIIICLVLGYFIYALFFKPFIVIVEEPEPGITIPEQVEPGQLPTAGELLPGVIEKIGERPTTPTEPGEIKEGEGLPEAPFVSEIAEGGLVRVTTLTENTVQDITLSSDGQNMNFYNPEDGKFYRVDEDGNTVLMTNRTFFNVSNVEWAPNTSESIIEYPDGSNIYFDFNSEKQVSLPRHWEEFDFGPSSNLVFKSLGISESNRWLVISDPEGKAVKKIAAMGPNADKVDVAYSPNNQVVAFSRTGDPQGFDRQEILLIGKYDENFKSLEVEGWGFIPVWNPSGTQVLYSVYNAASDMKPLLWIVDGQGENIGRNRMNLQINTWADKCTFASDTMIYCAVPREMPEGAGFLRTSANEIPDDIYALNLANNSTTLLARPETDISISQIMVSEDESNLFLTDIATGKLHKIRLR